MVAIASARIVNRWRFGQIETEGDGDDDRAAVERMGKFDPARVEPEPPLETIRRPTVEPVPQHGATQPRQVGAELVGTPGDRFEPDKRGSPPRRRTGNRPPTGGGGASHDRIDPLPGRLRRVWTERQMDRSGRSGGLTANDRHVGFPHSTPLEGVAQRSPSRGRPGEHEQPRSVTIEPMNRLRRRRIGQSSPRQHPRHVGRIMRRPCRDAGHPGGLVDDDEMVVEEHDPDRHRRTIAPHRGRIRQRGDAYRVHNTPNASTQAQRVSAGIGSPTNSGRMPTG